jgi:hypothetical protein
VGTNDGLRPTTPSPKQQKNPHIPTVEYVQAGYSAKRQMIRVTPCKIKDLKKQKDPEPIQTTSAAEHSDPRLSDQQSKYQKLFKGLMAPSGPTLVLEA